jgi:lipopolysaccharide biosynthesis regulator YciM
VSEISDTRPLTPAPAKLEVQFDGKVHTVSYEQAFAIAFTLIDQKQFDEAARIFERLQAFTDRGPRAFIMQAYCEAAALHFDSCSKPLAAAFDGENRSLAADLHNAFISYHVGIRQDAITALTEIANQHRELPTVCLLLGDMFHATGKTDLGRKCWSLAVKRDWPNGSVALVATRHMQSLANKQTSTS